MEACGEGPAIVFSAGYVCARENFRPQVEPLVAAGFRVVLWDYRGHGESDAPEDPEAYSLEHVLGDLGCVLDWAAPGEPAVLAGFSFGGLASLHFALRNPERVRALALIDTGPGFKKAEAQERWMALVERTASILETGGFERFLGGKGAATAIGRDPESPAARAAAAAIARGSAQGVAHFGRRVAGPAPACIDELPRIDAPALVLVGEEDQAYLRAADVLAARLPKARKLEIPGAGHVVTLEAPDAVNRALLHFLAELSE